MHSPETFFVLQYMWEFNSWMTNANEKKHLGQQKIYSRMQVKLIYCIELEGCHLHNLDEI